MGVRPSKAPRTCELGVLLPAHGGAGMKEPRKSPPREFLREGGGEARRGDRGIVLLAIRPPTRRPLSAGQPGRSVPRPASRRATAEAEAAAFAVPRRGAAGITNAPPSSPGVSSSSVTLTVANCGPLRISATSASTAAGGPRISASTAPSYRLRTQPETLSLTAARRVNSR